MKSYVKDNEWGTKYPHFQKCEFMCPCCGSVGDGIATSLVELLETLREKYGAIIITSGFRCKKYNREVGGVSNSAHLKGQASDIYFSSGITNNQDLRVAIVREIQSLPNYHYSYCNVNGDFPNMGNAIHIDTYLTEEAEEPIIEKPEEPVIEKPNENPKEEPKEKPSLLRILIDLIKELIDILRGKI